jgi:nitrogen regulatory protein PII
MSTEAIPVKPAVLITIISESVLKERLIKLLKSKGVTGYTINDVLGEGGHGRRMGDIVGYNTNIEMKSVVSPDVSDEIFQTLAEMRNEHALIAFRHDVEVLKN